jgi:hypothetical protein
MATVLVTLDGLAMGRKTEEECTAVFQYRVVDVLFRPHDLLGPLVAQGAVLIGPRAGHDRGVQRLGDSGPEKVR